MVGYAVGATFLLAIVMIAAIGYRRTGDARLMLVIAVAILARLVVAIYNITSGPLTGANVDAVFYESHAWDIAQQFNQTGHFTLELGRNGYSDLIQVPYILGGRHAIY